MTYRKDQTISKIDFLVKDVFIKYSLRLQQFELFLMFFDIIL